MKTTEYEIAPAGLRLPEASRYIGVSPALLKKYVRENRVTSVKLGRTRVFPRTALDELLTVRAA
jgi:excisionase family DNA binding protein